ELEVVARDSAGNSTTVSLTVHASNAVSEATITSPADGAVVRCMIQVKANVNVPNLASVEFVIGGVGLPYFTAPPYELNYDTRNRLDGELPILLRATDLYGNVTTGSITVVVDNLEVKITPETLELKSKGGDKVRDREGRGQSAHLLWLAQPEQITLCVPGGSPIPATLVHGQHLGWRCFFEHHSWHRGRRHGHEHGCHGSEPLGDAGFNRQLLIGALRGAGLTNGKVEMTIKVTQGGQTFVIGSDTIRVKSH
ncbi:MAG: hypothetical protein IPK67_20575, partial [Planctomycetes bacterium]|nr:hypothetical protein [Planctomycetota bacterium]